MIIVFTFANSTYKKLAGQWLNEVTCFVTSSVLADSLRFRNRQLLIAANRYEHVIQTWLSPVCHRCPASEGQRP
jgi:hypothetical protein